MLFYIVCLLSGGFCFEVCFLLLLTRWFVFKVCVCLFLSVFCYIKCVIIMFALKGGCLEAFVGGCSSVSLPFLVMFIPWEFLETKTRYGRCVWFKHKILGICFIEPLMSVTL